MVAKKLIEEVLFSYGFPTRIRSDKTMNQLSCPRYVSAYPTFLGID